MSDAVRTEAGAFVNKAWLLDENNAGRLLNIDLLKGTPPRLPLIATCAR
ncbi:MAG: hypothetical protein R3D66_00895 [Alphaproteobacteria bacterium]